MRGIESLFGRTLWVLVDASIVLAVVMLLLLQAHLTIRLGMRLYWRWKASVRLLRADRTSAGTEGALDGVSGDRRTDSPS